MPKFFLPKSESFFAQIPEKFINLWILFKQFFFTKYSQKNIIFSFDFVEFWNSLLHKDMLQGSQPFTWLAHTRKVHQCFSLYPKPDKPNMSRTLWKTTDFGFQANNYLKQPHWFLRLKTFETRGGLLEKRRRFFPFRWYLYTTKIVRSVFSFDIYQWSNWYFLLNIGLIVFIKFSISSFLLVEDCENKTSSLLCWVGILKIGKRQKFLKMFKFIT